jgi:hypothetical protein
MLTRWTRLWIATSAVMAACTLIVIGYHLHSAIAAYCRPMLVPAMILDGAISADLARDFGLHVPVGTIRGGWGPAFYHHATVEATTENIARANRLDLLARARVTARRIEPDGWWARWCE